MTEPRLKDQKPQFLPDTRASSLGYVLLLLLGVVLLMSCIALASVGFFTRQPGCPYYRSWFRNNCEFSRDLSIRDLYVDQNFFPFPTEIEVDEVVKHDFGAGEVVAVIVRSERGQVIAQQEIWRWAWEEQAEEGFDILTADEFGIHQWPCCTHEDFQYESSVADQAVVRCSTGGVCTAVLRYVEYICILEMEISSDVTQADFASTVQKIDDHFASVLIQLSETSTEQ